MSKRNPRLFTDLCDDAALIRRDSQKLTSLLAYMEREMLVG